MGPMAAPRGPLGAQGCHFGRVWGHVGDIFEAKIMPTSMTKFVFFSRADFGVFRGACVCVSFFDVFRGLQRRIAKNLDM